MTTTTQLPVIAVQSIVLLTNYFFKIAFFVMFACLLRCASVRGGFHVRITKAVQQQRPAFIERTRHSRRRSMSSLSVDSTTEQQQQHPRSVSTTSEQESLPVDVTPPCTTTTGEEEYTAAAATTTRDTSSVLDTTSGPFKGQIVARILPRSFVEYQQRKPDCTCDTAALLQRLASVAPQREPATSSSSSIPTIANDDDPACHLIGMPWCDDHDDEQQDWIVALDVNLECTDTSEDSSSADSFGTSTTEEEEPSSSRSSRQRNNSLYFHLNRDASELAQRTLQRLEISTAKKIQCEQYGYGKRAKKKLAKQLLADGVTTTTAAVPPSTTASSSIWIPTSSSSSGCAALMMEDADGDKEDGDAAASSSSEDGYRSLDVSKCKSADLLKQIVSCVDVNPTTRNSTILSLSTPVGSIPLQVESCPPTIMSVQTFEHFDSRLFVGVPLVISTEVLNATRAVVSWFADGVQVCHDSSCYTPVEADVGKSLSVLIVPIRPGHDGGGHEEGYRFQNVVEPLPFMPLISPLRDEWTKARTDESLNQDLRVVTYNLLADLYTSRELDQQLMYNHCPIEYLKRNRRMPMLVYEMLSYHADVICLQEVDAHVFNTLFLPVMESQGYQGYYSNKASSQLEGCAMFWSLQCFERAKESDQHTYSIRDLFGNGTETDDPLGNNPPPKHRSYSKWDSMDNIDELLCQHPELRRVTREKVGQILQIATLTLRKKKKETTIVSNKPDKVVIGNTHLFYHPMADHVRAMQAYVVCKQMDTVRRRRCDGGIATNNNTPYPLLFCGDLNSGPLAGALHLLLQRQVGPDHFETWKHLHEYNWEMGDYEFMLEHGYVGNDAVSGADPTYLEESFQDAREYDESLEKDENVVSPPPIVLPESFPNLFSGYQEMPLFSNLAVDFEETLDYVLASEPSSETEEPFGFGPKKSAPMPEIGDVKQYVAMPNEFMPSDHVSLVCDLEWKRYTKED